MSQVVLPTKVLLRLRKIGDPALQAMTPAERAFDEFRKRPDLLPAALMPDPDKLVVAQRLFGDHIAEISGALLLAALPQSYATEYGAAVLGAHGQLTSDLTQRIGRTAQFLLTVMQQGADTAADQNRLWDWRQSKDVEFVANLPWAACVRLRLFHQIVRDELKDASADERIKDLLGEENRPPLNQEDLLAMLLMFSFVVFEVLDLYGINWTADEQEAYLHLWDVVGGYLGIGSDSVKKALQRTYKVPADWHGLRPPTIDRSHSLLNQIRARQWIDVTPEANVSAWSWTALRSGRVLARALLDELEEGMPPLLKPLPIAIIRALNPQRVGERLNLGANGVLLQSLTLLPKRQVRVAGFTSIRSPNKTAGRVLRMLANDVTARASVHLGEKYQITIPGAPDWHHTP